MQIRAGRDWLIGIEGQAPNVPADELPKGDLLSVSSNGLCLGLHAALERGRELDLWFDLPEGRVEAVGEVRWAVEQRGRVELGVRFVRISSESLANISSSLG